MAGLATAGGEVARADPDEEDALHGAPNLGPPNPDPTACIPSTPGIQLRASAASRRGSPERKNIYACFTFVFWQATYSLHQARAAPNRHGQSWQRVHQGA